MFPITYRYQYNYVVQGDEYWITGVLRTRIATALKKADAQHITIETQRVAIEGRFLSILYPNWRLFSVISKGEVAVTCQSGRLSVTAEINFIGLMLFALCASVFPIMVAPGFLGLLGVWLGLVWVWLFGANVLLASFRFRGFMRNQLSQFFDFATSAGVHGRLITSR